MTLLSKAKKLLLIVKKPSLLKPQEKYIFMLSHMRSRSSLLSHILGSNDEICGYSELHYSYPKVPSLVNMHVELYQDLSCDFTDKYLFDKLLHNSMLLNDDVLERTKPKVILLYRAPQSTLKSIINMGDLTGDDGYKNQSIATDYYCNRLRRLAEYAKKDIDVLFIDSDELVNNTEEVLIKLSNWLCLASPLSSNYTIFNRTGVTGAGDPSKNIMSGQIVKTKQHESIILDEHLLEKAIEAYTAFKAAIA
jgi:hypothetical protein